jgi:hypothetical protein
MHDKAPLFGSIADFSLKKNGLLEPVLKASRLLGKAAVLGIIFISKILPDNR